MKRHRGEMTTDGLNALADNVFTFFDSTLPMQSWLRVPLTAALLHGDVSRDDAVAASGMKRNTISKARTKRDAQLARSDFVDPLQQAAPSGQFRAKRVSVADEEKKDNALQFLRDNYSVSKSGDVREVYSTHFARFNCWQKYVAHEGTAGQVIFQAAWKELGVTRMPHSLHDYFSCSVCQAGHDRAAQFELQANHYAEERIKPVNVAEIERLEHLELIARGSAAEILVWIFLH